MEVIICGALILGVLLYNNTIDGKKFLKDNDVIFEFLREDDYNFLVAARYGENADPNILFHKRLKYAFITIVVFLFIFLTELSAINVVLSILVGYLVFKSNYTSLKKYYKKHLHDIDIMLPYGVAIGAILGILIASINDNVAFLVYGIIIGLFIGVGLFGFFLKNIDNTKNTK